VIDLGGLPLPENAPPPGTCVKIERPEAGLVVLRLEPPHREATVLDLPLVRDLDLALDQVGRGTRGLVVTGRAPTHFAYGADLDALESVTDRTVVERFVRAMHGVLRRIEGLSLRSVAAVGGPVPGGALELPLACDLIVAADHPSTRLGLPETQLGILPAWGGVHRLPRRIGVVRAMEAILKGRLYPARQALRLGIVDRLTPPEYLMRVAADVALGRDPSTRKGRRGRGLAGFFVDRNPLATALIAKKSRERVMEQSKGHYPAVLAVIPIIAAAPRTSMKAAEEKEVRAAAELATGPVAKSLIAIFRASEAAKKLAVGADGRKAPRFERAGVVGGGVMGGAIASLMAEKGIATRIADLSRAALDAALVEHAAEVAKKRRRRQLEPHEADAAIDRLDAVEGTIGLARAQIVLEAVAEKLEVKRAVFAALARELADDAVLATNTSSLSVDAIAAGLPHPERVVGVHFFNPVRKMPLVEIVRGARTSEDVVRRAAGLALHLGKTPVVVKDVAGFLVNRLLGPYLDEALRLFGEGFSPARLDALLEGFGMPMGPLRLLDEVGFDIATHAAASLFAAYGERMTPSSVLEPAVREGRRGKKTGRGFYEHPKGRGAQPTLCTDLGTLRQGEGLATLSDEAALDRCLLPMLNEAARCFEEEVVMGPVELDLATVLGMGFAPFRGGLLRWADTLGAQAVVERIERIAAAGDVARRPGGAAKFTPAPLLARMAGEGRRFHG